MSNISKYLTVIFIISCCHIQGASEATYLSPLQQKLNQLEEVTALINTAMEFGESPETLEELFNKQEKLQQEIKTLIPDIASTRVQEKPVTPLRTINDIVEYQDSPGFQEDLQQPARYPYEAHTLIQVPSFNISLPALPHKVTIMLLPCLQQARSAKFQTNYCGYYSIFNALQLQGNAPADQLVAPTSENRKKFRQYFERWLNIDQQYRTRTNLLEASSNKNLSNIGDDEINDIIDKNHLNVPATSLYPLIIELTSLSVLSEILPTQYGPLFDFSKSTGAQSISFIAGSASKEGHWFAIKAERDTQGNLILYVADSLHLPSWYDEYQVITRILPYAYLLMGALDIETAKIFQSIQ